MSDCTGTVFNIQRFSIHDGPGIRTTVFLKGCNLHCVWCHNPESIDARPEIQYYAQKCIGCGMCFAQCPAAAHRMEGEAHVFDRARCTRCGVIEPQCPAGAIEICGTQKTPEEVLEEVLRDLPFYRNSGGGVTFSGGEALMQKDFTLRCMQLCKQSDLHTALDTAGALPWAHYQAILPYTDLFLYDIKCMDPARHKEYTGADNGMIHENLRLLAQQAKEIWVRIPVIPGVNDSEEEIDAMAALIRDIRGAITLIELLPYHRLGGGKYESLGKRNPMDDRSPPDAETMDALTARIRVQGIEVKHS